MTIVTQMPHKVRQIENHWIKLKDGTRLAARIWLPEDADKKPVPAVLEYIPYRKRDFTRGRDEPMHAYFAGHGFAALRVDMRGCGESDGLMHDEYTQQEHDDALEVIAWAAAQPWCSGKVGRMGKSWGGFNSLQVAARRPPALKAILTVCSTDDRYADDIHYMGGCLLNDNLWWGTIMLAFAPRPGDPALVGDAWRQQFKERFEATPLFPALWLRHQRRDAYWQRGSVCEDYSAIECPVFAVGGWADGYSNAVPRLLAGLKVPTKGLVGPWAHLYPHDGFPAPAIGFLQEAVRWWRQWLKDEETGIMDEPSYRVWMQESVPPQATYQERPGRWVAEAAWPSARIENRVWHLNAGTLDPEAAAERALPITSPQSVGMAQGAWSGFGVPGEMPLDQRLDDGGCLVFTSTPLSERLEILGAPAVELELASDQANAFVAVRLNDVAPDGQSTRVTYGLLNLTHRKSHAAPEPLIPGQRIKVRVQMNDIAHVFPAGHRLAVSLSNALWPMVWPSPKINCLTLFTGASRLSLPVRPPLDSDRRLRDLGEPERARPMAVTLLSPGSFTTSYSRDVSTGEVRYLAEGKGGLFGEGVLRMDDIDLVNDHSLTREYRIKDNDPLSAAFRITQSFRIERGDWSIRVDTQVRMTSTEKDFIIEASLDAFEGDARLHSREWRDVIPRDGM